MDDNKKDYFMQEDVLDDKDIVKNTIIKMHNENKSDVPKYLDDLKKEKNNKKKEATSDNDFLKYML